jgi:hypothetical protein
VWNDRRYNVCRVFRASPKILTAGAVLVSLACGEGDGDNQETAGLIPTLNDAVAAGSVDCSAVASPMDVVVVDEHGLVADSATEVTDQLTLTVPTGHDSVIIVSNDRPDFTVAAGAATVHRDSLTVDRARRPVVTDASDGEIATSLEPRIDASAPALIVSAADIAALLSQ